MKSIKKICFNILNVLKTKYLWISMALCLFLFFYANVNGADSSEKTGLVLTLIKQGKAAALAEGNDLYSREMVMTVFGENYWFPILFPAIVAFATVDYFADQWSGAFYYFNISRTGKKKYAITEVLSSFIISFLTMTVCILIFDAIVWFTLPSFKQFGDWQYGIIAFAQGVSWKRRLLVNVLLMVKMGSLAGLYSLICMFFVIVFKDRFFAITIPVMINYISKKALPIFINYTIKHNISATSKINYIGFLIPEQYFSLNYLIPGNMGNKSKVALILLILFLALIMGTINSILICRRSR